MCLPVAHAAGHGFTGTNGTNKTKSSFAVLFLSGSLVVRTRTLSKTIVRTLSLAWRIPTRSSASTAVTVPVLCFFPKLRVTSSLQLIRAKDSGILLTTPLAVRISSDIFVRQARAFDERGVQLINSSPATFSTHLESLLHLLSTRKTPECALLTSSLVSERGDNVSKVRAKPELLAVSAAELEELLATIRAPSGDVVV